MDNKRAATIKYALSIHMKYGEVLHVEDLTKEEKDKYLDLAKHEEKTMTVEDNVSVRHLLSRDISKISVKPYDESYEKWIHPIEKMLFSESSLGRKLFSLIIKSFLALSVFIMMGVFAVAMIEGNIVDVFFEAELFAGTISKGIDAISTLYGYTLVLMVLLNLVDIVLGLRSHYFMNQDGEEAAEFSRLSNVFVTIAFIIGFSVLKIAMSGLINIL